MLRMIVRYDRIVNELGNVPRPHTQHYHLRGDQGTVLYVPLYCYLHKLFQVDVI